MAFVYSCKLPKEVADCNFHLHCYKRMLYGISVVKSGNWTLLSRYEVNPVSTLITVNIPSLVLNALTRNKEKSDFVTVHVYYLYLAMK